MRFLGRQEVKMRGSWRTVRGVRQSVVWWVEGREEMTPGGGGRQLQGEEQTHGLPSGLV